MLEEKKNNENAIRFYLDRCFAFDFLIFSGLMSGRLYVSKNNIKKNTKKTIGKKIIRIKNCI